MCCCCECCLCCFRSMSPLAIAITGLVLKIIAFVFVIWQAADFLWIKKYIRALFWIGFVLALLGLLGVIALLILVLVRNNANSSGINSIGKIICIVLLIILPIAVILFVISSIGAIIEYVKDEIERWDDDYEYKYYKSIPGRYWASVTVPPYIYLIFISVLTKCLRALYIIFNEDIYDSIQDKRIRDNINIIQNQTNQANAVVNQTVPGPNQIVLNTTNPTAYNPNLTSTTPMDNLNNNPNPNYAMNNMNPAYPKIN